MSEKKEPANRRDFLKLAGASAPAAVAAAAVTVGGNAEAAQPVDASSGKMQDTAHTRAYFASAKF